MRFYAIINSDRTVVRFFESKRKAVLDLHYNPLDRAQIFSYHLMPHRGSPVLKGQILELIQENLDVQSIGRCNFTSLEDTIDLCSINNRLYPESNAWVKFHRFISITSEIDQEFEPPVPMILGNFHLPDEDKIEQLNQQLKWCGKYGILNETYDFLFKLRDEDWHYSLP